MNEELHAIAATAAQICSEWTPEAAARYSGGWADEVWDSLTKAEFTVLPVPESSGGAGAGLAEAAVVVHEIGRAAVPVPLTETALLAGWLLTAASRTVPTGPLTASAPTDMAVDRCAGGYRLTGKLSRVPYGHLAERVAVLLDRAEPLVAILDSPREAWERGRNLAGEPRDTLLLQDTFVPGEDVTEVDATISGRAFRVRGALGRALLLSGAMEAALDSTITYAGQREQFGRPISRFQAVSHHLAAMAEEAAASTTVAMSAATAGQQPDWILTAAAKAQAGRAAGVVARLAHQVHGALGFTDEHPLRLITTRLWSWRDEFGNERFWERELGAAACAAPDLWTLVTDPAEVRANG